jgi:hypothetical protein
MGRGEILLQLSSLAVCLNTLHNAADPEGYLQAGFWAEEHNVPDALGILGILKSKASIEGLSDNFFCDL